jgi:GNAT superfamily N-acetyltransferase
MNLIEFDNVEAFADRAMPFLIEREAERCVELGIISALREGKAGHRGHALEQPLLWVAEDESTRVVATLMQSVVDRMIISRAPIAAMQRIARRLHEIGWSGIQINGMVPSVRDGVDAFSRLSGRKAHRAMQLRTFQLDRIIPPRAASGAARLADDRDRDLLRRWTVAFARAVGDDVPDSDGDHMANRLITEQRAWLWERSNEPVAMAAHAGPTPNGIRVNFVYTPEPHRGHGYASNLVAHISQYHLDAGKRFCFLHTDLANLTSNKIYQQIGYRAVADSERWELERDHRAIAG